MKVLCMTVGDENIASSRTRVYQYLPLFEREGIEVEILNYYSRVEDRVAALRSSSDKEWRVFEVFLRKLLRLWCICFTCVQVLRLIVLSRFSDVVFIQKVLLPIWVQTVLKSLNPNIVFDYDDAVYATSAPNGRERFENLLKSSKLAVVENDETERYANRFGVPTIRITGPIDTDRYRPASTRADIRSFVIGWVGSPGTTPYLHIVAGALRRITERFPQVIVDFIGAAPVEMAGVRIREYKWSLDTEVGLMEGFDVGIMPLPDNEWTRSKGGYKLLQYMAMGLPGVASPVGVNSEIIQHGATGFLASSDDEWVEALVKLVENPELRRSMGERARKVALDKFSLQSNGAVLCAALRTLKQ